MLRVNDCCTAFIVAVASLALAITVRADDSAQRTVNFMREVRPILTDVCFGCHGPDESSREADLRLDRRDDLFSRRDDAAIVEPGQPEHSLLFQRITADDPDQRMPPADAPRQLSEEQIDVLKRWIREGASWEEHWAFIPPRRPALPEVQNRNWPLSGLDYFVLERLEAEGLEPSQPAARETWIRRVTLDLTGLPPTPAEVAAYLEDTDPSADEKLVERLLASPHFGERLAVDWLDAARYADTSGYQNDGPRSMWRWRDWVIAALNRNQPFDQFTIEQIAGDLLPGATRDQIIATGFNRNHRGNSEGGIIPEEFAIEYVVDRVDTTATVWLGLTMGCARCHDHKYDPLRQKEFYQMFAYFNNVPEHGRAIKEGNSPPYIMAPTPEHETALRTLDELILEAEQLCANDKPQLDRTCETLIEFFQLQAFQHKTHAVDWTVTRGLNAQFVFAHSTVELANPPNPLPYETTFVGGESFVDAPVGRAASCDDQRFVDAGDVGNFGYFDKFSLSAWIQPTDAHGGTIMSRMTDVAEGDGYSLELHNGRLQLNLVKRWLDDSLRVELPREIPLNQWTHVAATYDGSRKATGIALYINGEPSTDLTVHLDALNQTFATKEPLRIGGGGGPTGRFHGHIGDVRVYERALEPNEVAVISVAQRIDEIIADRLRQELTACQQQKLRGYVEAIAAPRKLRNNLERLRQLRQQRQQLLEQIPTVMVMQELPTARQSHVLERGQYDRPGEAVTPGIPSCLPPMSQSAPNNRLGFAMWLGDAQNPLTSRVAVNRYWQMIFGVGLVKTAEDFGIQGEAPSHPELLDWLAAEFMESGWDIKHLLKTIVLSSTYRQSSHAPAEIWQRDPENRLLARGPRIRLPAELVRDQALAASGLLVGSIGGPSVKPYQPAGLWKEIATDVDYGQGHGADLYRRSLYTYWKRTVAPPTMVTFDAFSRETCMLRRSRTNTPLQALASMNDPTFVEAARKLAERSLHEGGTTSDERISYMYLLATARRPSSKELEILSRSLQRNVERFQADDVAANQLLEVGEAPLDSEVDRAQLAAYTVVASLILNSDEVLTKE